MLKLYRSRIDHKDIETNFAGALPAGSIDAVVVVRSESVIVSTNFEAENFQINELQRWTGVEVI